MGKSIFVKVKAGSNRSYLENLGENEYFAEIKADREHGEANKEIITLISKELGVHFSKIKIKNFKSERKIIEILD